MGDLIVENVNNENFKGLGEITVKKTTGSSMEPLITDNTLVVLDILENDEFSEIKLCDIVWFEDENEVLLHRVINIDTVTKAIIIPINVPVIIVDKLK